MIIAAVMKSAEGLRALTDQLLSIFPGGVIYAFTSHADALECVRTHKLDGVILACEPGDPAAMNLLNLIRRQDLSIPVALWAEDDALLEEAMWNGATGYISEPLSPELIRAALGLE